ncbi:hypothetical protein Tco_0405669 [Tanacetum coccineum]
MVEQNHGEHLICRFAGRGNELDPRDVKIASLKQQIQEFEFPQLQQDSPAEEVETKCHSEGIRICWERRIWGEEDNIEDAVVVANDLCSSMIHTILSVDFEEDINTKSHELMSFGKRDTNLDATSKGMNEANSRTSFFQVGEDDAD